MYKVNNTLTSAYGNPMDMQDFKAKQGPEMPRASVNNKKMTNVALSNGEHVMGIRKNPEDETYGDQKLAGDAMEMPIGRPLRYTPGLRCDAHLESLRPERAGNHRAIQGGEDWKRKLVQPPNHFDGSFVDADLQRFRPEPNPSPAEDPWYASRLPDQTMLAYDRLQAPQATYGYPEMPLSGPYGSMYPQDELSRIKMRNRRFMSSCAQEMAMPGMAPGMMQPVMMAPMMQQQPMMMMGPPPTLDHELAGDELSILDQELNMTRRANRPFVPSGHDNYFALQRQVQDMEQPPEPRKQFEVTSVEQLPLPKRTIRTTAETAAVKSNRPEVNIADQIAIRSMVLGKSLGKTAPSTAPVGKQMDYRAKALSPKSPQASHFSPLFFPIEVGNRGQ